MVAITESERKYLTIELAKLAEYVDHTQEALLSEGFSAFKPSQLMLFEFAQNDCERDELNLYLRELAKELLGSIRHQGSGVFPGDGVRSEYLETLRLERNRTVGGFEEYRASAERWRFEINPVVKRMWQYRVDNAADYKRRDDQVESDTRRIIASEAAKEFVFRGRTDFADTNYTVKSLREAYERHFHFNGVVIGRGKIQDLKPIIAFPVNELWTMAVYINMPKFLLQPGLSSLLFFDQHIALVKTKPLEAVKNQLKTADTHHRLRLEGAIYGFGYYRTTHNLAEMDLAVRVYARLISLFLPKIKTAVNVVEQM